MLLEHIKGVTLQHRSGYAVFAGWLCRSAGLGGTSRDRFLGIDRSPEFHICQSELVLFCVADLARYWALGPGARVSLHSHCVQLWRQMLRLIYGAF